MNQLYFILATCMFLSNARKIHSWGYFCNEYRVTFKDGRQVCPIRTCSWSYNWIEKDGLTTFYWKKEAKYTQEELENWNYYFKQNWETIEKAGVTDLVTGYFRYTEEFFLIKDEYITFKDVLKVEQTR